MREKLIGNFAIVEGVSIIIAMLLFAVVNGVFIFGALQGYAISQFVQFEIMLLNLVALLVGAVAWVPRVRQTFPNSRISQFFDFLPKSDDFSVLTVKEFLGTATMAGTIACLIGLTSKSAWDFAGPSLTAVYVFIVYLTAITVGVIGVIRCTYPLREQSFLIFGPVFLSTTLIFIGIFQVLFHTGAT